MSCVFAMTTGRGEVEFWLQAHSPALPLTGSLQHRLLSRDQIWETVARMETKEKLGGRKWHIRSSASLTFPLLCACPLRHIHLQMKDICLNIGICHPGQNAQISWAHRLTSIFFSPRGNSGSFRGFPRWTSGKGWPANAGDLRVWSLDEEDPLEEGAATPSSILAWRIPWTEEPGGLQTTGSQRVGHDWSDLAGTQRFAQWCLLVRRFSTERDPVGDWITCAGDPQPMDSPFNYLLMPEIF